MSKYMCFLGDLLATLGVLVLIGLAIAFGIIICKIVEKL